MRSRPLTRTDALLMALLVLLSSIALAFTLNGQHHWGDDFSVYIQQGIAIAEGRFHEQAIACAQTRWSNGPFYYVWGHSLFLALVYRAVGFDRASFESIIFYKLPSAFSLMLLSILCYLWLRRRFTRGLAFIGGSIFALGTQGLILANEIMTDLPYAACCMLFFLLADNYMDRPGPLRGLLLGAAAYVSFLFRYAGATLLAALALYQLLRALRCVVHPQKPVSPAALAAHLSPYMAFAALYLLVGSFMPYAASEADRLSVYPALLIDTAYEYYYHLRLFFFSFLPLTHSMLFVLCLVFIGIGVLSACKKEGLPLLFLALTMLGLLSLPYTQGIRYMFNLLPLYVMFFFHGICFLWRKAAPVLASLPRAARFLKALAFILTLCTLVHGALPMASENIKAARRPQTTGAYTAPAIEVYRYILKELSPDARILFNKARALSLNTDRVCYQTWGHFEDEPLDERLAEIDYLLICNELALNQAERRLLGEPQLSSRLHPEFSNDRFTLYRIAHQDD